jgi:pilus assembly protein CpaB
MKSKTVILLVVAGVCGLVASYMTSRFLANQNEKVSVLVAKDKIAPWTQIKEPELQFDVEERPRNEVPKNTVFSPDAVKDQVLMKGLEKGDILVSDNIADKKAIGIEVNIPRGFRAVGVRTTQEANAGGFVLPGSKVDVIHTGRGSDKEVKGQMILQNVLVLAVDLMEKRPEDKAGMVPTTVTLLVTPEEATILAAAQNTGVITFSLRSKQDETRVVIDQPPPKPEPKVEQPKVEQPEPVVVAPPPPPPEPPAQVQKLTIFNGQSVTTTTWTTKNGETETSTERSGPEPLPPASFQPPAPPAAKDKEGGTGNK